MEEESDACYVVRKGDIVGVYGNFNDCEAQVGSSVFDPAVSVYKGYSLHKQVEEYLVSKGFKNSIYTIRLADVKEDLFGTLVPYHFEQLDALSSSRKTSAQKILNEVVELDNSLQPDAPSSSKKAYAHKRFNEVMELEGSVQLDRPSSTKIYAEKRLNEVVELDDNVQLDSYSSKKTFAQKRLNDVVELDDSVQPNAPSLSKKPSAQMRLNEVVELNSSVQPDAPSSKKISAKKRLNEVVTFNDSVQPDAPSSTKKTSARKRLIEVVELDSSVQPDALSSSRKTSSQKILNEVVELDQCATRCTCSSKKTSSQMRLNEVVESDNSVDLIGQTMAREKFYVVFVGRRPGIYSNWEDCYKQVIGYKGACHYSFRSLHQAEERFRRFKRENDKGRYFLTKSICGTCTKLMVLLFLYFLLAYVFFFETNSADRMHRD